MFLNITWRKVIEWKDKIMANIAVYFSINKAGSYVYIDERFTERQEENQLKKTITGTDKIRRKK